MDVETAAVESDGVTVATLVATLVMGDVTSTAAEAVLVIVAEAPDAINVGANSAFIEGNIGRVADAGALSTVTVLVAVGVPARDCEAMTDNRCVSDDDGEAGIEGVPVAVPVGELTEGKFPISCANVLLRRVYAVLI